jgi:hypothetical protein
MIQSITERCYRVFFTVTCPPDQDDTGQTTAEYALVLAGVGGVVALFMAWASKTGLISTLFNAVFQRLIDAVKA